jgi:hypothetical protein
MQIDEYSVTINNDNNWPIVICSDIPDIPTINLRPGAEHTMIVAIPSNLKLWTTEFTRQGRHCRLLTLVDADL